MNNPPLCSVSLSRFAGIVLGTICSALGLLGCGSLPMPTIAVAGTTVVIAVPTGFRTGYGRVLAGNPGPSGNPFANVPAFSGTSPLEDPQRGELVFALYTEAGAFVSLLPLQYITRVNMSPQSRSASAGSMLYEAGQTIAFVNIPASVVPAGQAAQSFRLLISRYRRQPVTGTFEAVPFVSLSGPPKPLPQGWSTAFSQKYLGWGDESVPTGMPSSPYGIPIKISGGDGQNHFTPLKGWSEVVPNGLGWGDVADDLAELVPYPEFDLLVPIAGSLEPRPAAWEVWVAYPPTTIRIRGVELRHPTRSSAIVRWEADDPNAAVACGAVALDYIKIKVIDPDRATSGVRIAYDLRNFDQTCGARATASTFNVWPGSFVAYDSDGEDITDDLTSPVVSGDAFF